MTFAWSSDPSLDEKPDVFLKFGVTPLVAVSYAMGMEKSTSRRARGIALASVVATACLWGSLGHPVHADEPVGEPPAATGEVDGAVVAVGLPPVPPTTVVVAVGLPPVPPTTVVDVADQPSPVLAVRQSVEVSVEVGDVIDVIADMVATVDDAVAMVDSHL